MMSAQRESTFGVISGSRHLFRRLRARRLQGHGGIGDGGAPTEDFPFEFLSREGRPAQQEAGDGERRQY